MVLRQNSKQFSSYDAVEAKADLNSEIRSWLSFTDAEIQSFWDCYDSEKVFFTESDAWHVSWALQQLANGSNPRGQGFVEWGSGFGVIAGVASLLGWNAVGVEAEDFLVTAARQTHERFKSIENGTALDATILCGNFLPSEAETLAEPSDPVVSMKHLNQAATSWEDTLCVTRFDLVFVYAWPGEEHFLKQVFDRFARVGARMLLYRGPLELEFYVKVR